MDMDWTDNKLATFQSIAMFP